MLFSLRVYSVLLCLSLAIILTSQDMTNLALADDANHPMLYDNTYKTGTGSGFAFGQASISTLENLNRLLSDDPRLEESRRQIEEFISEVPELFNPAEGIPLKLAFHILHHADEERIEESQIQTQIEALNNHFGRYNDDFSHPSLEREGIDKLIGELHLSFELDLDLGDPITYTEVEQESWKIDDEMKASELGGKDAINPESVINIWVVNLGGESRGFSQMPGADILTDGIVIDYRCIGVGGSAMPPYNQGKTLTHLIANYLNVYSLWGEGYCRDDLVSDTPIHNAPNFGCPTYKHITTCSDRIVAEMTINFMDNTDDRCTNMFSKGQRDRIYANLMPGGPRHSLIVRQ